MNIQDSITKIPYIGPTQANILSRLGIKSIEDLLNYAPRDLLDLQNVIPIAQAHLRAEKQVICAEIIKTDLFRTPRKRMWVVSAKIKDDSGEIEAVWFNQPYLQRSLRVGQKYTFYGEIEYNFSSHTKALSNPQIFPELGLIPLYPLTSGITSRQINKFVKLAISNGYNLKEFLPKEILQKNNLMPLHDVARALHSPLSVENFNSARHRLNFNHLLEFIIANLLAKRSQEKQKAYRIAADKKQIQEFVSSLPFQMTDDQNRSLAEILADLEKPHPMNRLLQGDVGSGKTIVALIASIAVLAAGYKVIWIVPTEILAQQHFETISKFVKFVKSKVYKVGLLTSSSKRLSAVGSQLEADILIGTHALFHNALPKDIALIVVDEQHRFGVKQREALLSCRCEKPATGGRRGNLSPHFLSLSATPIPRSLAHIVFGNLDISTIKQMPKGRKPVKTFLVPENKRAGAYKFIDNLIAKDQQAFVICPLIEASSSVILSAPADRQEVEGSLPLFDEKAERKTVKDEIENLKKTILGKRKIAALHGKMKSADKEQIMTKMSREEIDILVSTSVVEVGVDISNASAIVVEDAERFGLSQLHQFRGRVGRSDIQSYCFLFTKNSENEKTRTRLKAFVRSNDGFKLAELDLKQRGPGTILGLEQSGFKGLNPLWFENTELLTNVSKTAREIVDDLDKLPVLKNKVLSQLETEHLE